MGPKLGPETFARVSDIASRIAGLSIPATKQSMVQSRLVRRLRATGQTHFEAYLDLVESAEGRSEIPEFISALTTNVSSFFREAHHFETLRTEVAPALLEKLRSGERVRIWSAGCSTGQEPYSIALTLLEKSTDFLNGDAKILATDVDHAVLETARKGVYEGRQLASAEPSGVSRYFERAEEDGHVSYAASSQLRSLIHFRHLNLIEPWPMKGQFDAIFCRNVLIYFSEETQSQLWPRFHSTLAPEGWLFIGHSERVTKQDEVGFAPTGVTTYRKTSASGVANK
jgi:chemotaxis protein methyltransferase CheR